MQSINHEFTRPASPQVPYLSPIPSNKNILVQTSFDANVPSNKIIHVTNYNASTISSTTVHGDSILEESCDSYLDSDPEDVPGKQQCDDVTSTQLSLISALNKVGATNHNAVKTENLEPYHIPTNRYQVSSLSEDISPQKELKNLMKEVEIANSSGSDYSPIDSPIIDKLTDEVPRIEIVEEPETTYRARYESEGCKGPIHGSSETGFPSVKIAGYIGEVTIRVFVVTRDNEPHLHTATGPGSTKSSCKEIVLEDGTPAVQMVLKPIDENDEMIAIFDQLSVRRVRNWEADRELRKRGIEPASWKSKKKEAKLAFQAHIKATSYHHGFVLTTYSRPFLCTAPSGNPEIWWASLSEGSPEGGEELGLIGKKFASGFKIRFFSKEDDGEFWEVCAEVDRAKSNLNACVVKVPPYKETTISENIVVYVEVRVGPEKEPRCSDPYPFTYVASKINDKCDNCVQIKGLLQRLFVEKSGDIPNGLSLRVPNHNNVSVKPDLMEMDPPKIHPTSTALNDVKTISHITTTNSFSHSPPVADLSPSLLPLLQPYVVKTGDIMSIVDNSGNRSDPQNNVGLLYVQKVPENNNNIPIMLNANKPLGALNLNPQKVAIPQPQNVSIALPKIIVPQAINSVPVSLTNHFPLPSVVQMCSVNTSVNPTLTKTAAGVTNLQHHTPTHQVIHVVSEHQTATQNSIKTATSAPNIPSAQFVINGVPVQTHQQFINNVHPIGKPQNTIATNSSFASNLQCMTESEKIRFVNSNTPLSPVVYVKTDSSLYNQIKEEESTSCYVAFQPGYGEALPLKSCCDNSVSSANSFTAVNSAQSLIPATGNVIFSSPSVTPVGSHVFHSHSQPLVCQTVSQITPSPSVQLTANSGILQPSQTLQLTPNTGLLPRDEKEIQIINKHIQNLQNELEEKQAASTLQYKMYQEQKNFVNVSAADSGVSSINSSVQQYAKSHNFDTNISPPSNKIVHTPQIILPRIESSYQLAKDKCLTTTHFKVANGHDNLQSFPVVHQHIPNNPLIGHQNSLNHNISQSQTDRLTNGSANSIVNSNITYSNRDNVQNLFVVSSLPMEQRSVGDTLNVSQLQQLRSQQPPISLTIFSQQQMLHTQSNGNMFAQHVHKDQTQSQISANNFQPMQLSPGHQDPQHFQHQQQLFSSVPNHVSNSHTNMNHISVNDNRWDRPTINDAIASNKVGYIDSNKSVKDSRPSSPMVISIQENEENNFMETLQQLNNDSQQYSSMTPTPVVTFDSNISDFDGTPQPPQRIENEIAEQDEFGQSNVSVDYSDAFKSARACESSAANWPFQKSDVDQSQYVQGVPMFSASSSTPSLSISSQQEYVQSSCTLERLEQMGGKSSSFK